LSTTTVMQSVATINSVRRADLSHQGCVAKSMLIFTLPPWGNCPMSDSWNKQRTEPRKFSAPTSKYIWNIFLQSPVKRQAQRITESSKFNLYYLLTFLVIIYISL